LFIFFYCNLSGQEPFTIVDSIVISGLKHTKRHVVEKELNFQKGDTIFFNRLSNIFKNNKDRLLGTGLFVDVKFNLKEFNSNTSKGKIMIDVKESWYIYPNIYMELTDRDFNEWFYDHSAQLNRINIAFQITHTNLSGNNDPLKLKIQRGISKKLELLYVKPFINDGHKGGILFNILYKYSKEIPFNTINNKLVLYRDETKRMISNLRITAGYTLRPAIYATHKFEFGYFNTNIDSMVYKNLNPDFLNNKTKEKYISLKYSYINDRRDFKIYPKKGYLLGFSIEKKGIGIFKDINTLDISLALEKYHSFSRNLFTSLKLRAKKRLYQTSSSYMMDKALGYEQDFLNGYELYVIDGQDYLYGKTSGKIKLAKGFLDLGRWINIKQFVTIPYQFHFSFNFDFGYVNNNSNFVKNNFTNRLIYGYGPGLDMIIYHNYFQLNFSINHLGEKGVFFHYNKEI
ncbi:MAG TPA: hypothetical protein ENK91_08650, partial [Bacteroidetes bacterium]|nr:hypothetical protein [Bacteroidota bacterium]